MRPLTSYLPFSRFEATSTVADTGAAENNYPKGYPQFTALLSTDDSFVVCRRFARLRARLLLLKQDKISMLEQRLDEIDQEETSLLFLGKSRCDENSDRAVVLKEIESSLADYDKWVNTARHVMSARAAENGDIESLQNWLNGTGSLARAEVAYLSHPKDLMCLAPGGDNAVIQLETWVEDKLIHLCFGLFDRGFHKGTKDPNVYLYSGPLIKRTAKAMLFTLITLLLLMPVVICNLLSARSVRIMITMAATFFYLFVLSQLTKSKTIDLVLAGATYATILIVFVSGVKDFQGQI